jgi:hypothetical protein
VRIVFRPLLVWPGEPTRYRKGSPFSSTYPATLNLLERELDMLGASEAVLQLAVTEAEIRTDGLPRANARPTHPGVILAFQSRHGPLQYATDVFDHWQDNLRAIALSLESLRRVDRYGITKRGEQYTGWKALPAGHGNGGLTIEQAARFLASQGNIDSTLSVDALTRLILKDRSVFQRCYRRAAARLHPDAGGTAEDFAQLQSARDLLEEAGR